MQFTCTKIKDLKHFKKLSDQWLSTFYGMWPPSRDSSTRVAPCSAINFLLHIKKVKFCFFNQPLAIS